MTGITFQNVVLVTVDCLRYDRCGFNGYEKPTTPHLDELSSNGCVFKNAYATGPYTPESFPGILAARHGFNSAVYDDIIWKALPNNSPTLASELSEAGYRTVATVTNPHLTPERNFDMGFDKYLNLRTAETDIETEAEDESLSRAESILKSLRDLAGQSLPYPLQASAYALFRYWQSQGDWPSVRGERVVTEFNNRLNGIEKPFFAWTHLMDPHAPIHPATENNQDDNKFARLYSDGRRMLDEYSKLYSDVYDGAVKYVDKQIGRIITNLQELDMWDETVIILTADHGEALYDRGTYGHPYHYMYNELLHVPLIVRAPDSVPISLPSSVEAPFSLAWLHELIADTAGVDRFELVSTTGRESHFEPEYTPLVISDSISDLGHSFAIRNESERLLRHYGERTSPNPIERQIMEEYTERNLVHINGKIAEKTKSGKIEHTAETLQTVPNDLPQIGEQLSNSAENRLRRLGYVE
jgi:choline-sulfatase